MDNATLKNNGNRKQIDGYYYEYVKYIVIIFKKTQKISLFISKYFQFGRHKNYSVIGSFNSELNAACMG